MGGGHSRPRRPPPKIEITIPDFPYPPEILSYIISQSSNYKISFTPPGAVSPVPLETSPKPDESSIIPSSTPSTWVDTEIPYSFDLSEIYGTTVDNTPVPTITRPIPTTPAKRTLPAFSDPTSQPTEPPNESSTIQQIDTRNRKNKFFVPSPPLTIPPKKAPPIWQAAIDAMEFTGGLNLPITTGDQMYTLYDNLQNKIKSLMDNGKDPNKNMAALIYFSTVVRVSFESFNKTLAYNYLNGKFPTVFPNSKSYHTFCMLNNYSNYASVIFNKNPNLNQYLDINDRVVKYFIPPILNSVLSILQKAIS